MFAVYRSTLRKKQPSYIPSKNFPCISMDMLQIGALVLLGRLVELDKFRKKNSTNIHFK